MQIFINFPREDPLDWAIIELQGSLETNEKASHHQIINPYFIGDLHFTRKGDPLFIIGHHILQGKEVKLDKPIAVLEKIKTQEEEKEKTEYIVKAMVKRKFQFYSRPKPIIDAVKKL